MSKVLRQVFQWRMLVVCLMGFSSGLPLLLIGGTLKAWLREDHVALATIGFFSLAGLPYTWKFVWAPLMDRFTATRLGRRRGWLILTQLAVTAAIGALAFQNPTLSLAGVALVSVLLGFFSASQDIVVDAYRREILTDEELGFGSALAVNGYRGGMWIAGSLALILAGQLSWKTSYLIMAGFMAVGILTTLFAPEPEVNVAPPRSIREAVIGPFKEFFSRSGVKSALTILAFILLYKIGDSMASDMFNPFYIDMKFTLTEIGIIAKTLGFSGLIVGGLLGGVVILRIGIVRSLWVFGVLQAVSTASFSVLASVGHSIPMLAAVIGFEATASGMATSAYVAYMASLTHKKFTATQYALLSSFMGVPRVIFGATSGLFAAWLGWHSYFIFCALLAIPGLALLHVIAPWRSGGAEPPPVIEISTR